ncbi:MAG: lipoyl(octanoyl) transferase LipB [Alphaproteobacteria bacterium]|nr:lipoyl(octanoyl) transferase LipB [Alphaproteobacteria bacterium]MCD8526161.1 lipoyl(octanoyl) transferase LipB [Alphaproteobacteria bacterium]
MTEFKFSDTPVPYEEALAFMDERVAGIYDGTAEECVWLLEHPPLYTAGTSAKDADLLNARFPVHVAGRGGEYTYHGPGQRVAYVMMDLRKRQKGPDIKAYVWFLEEWIIRSLAAFGITGKRICGRVGIWVDMPDGTEKKIAAIGVRVRRWVTLHGIAINVNPDLSHFGGIVPCGISDAGVTSMAELGSSADMTALDRVLKEKFKTIPLQAQAQQCR